MAQYRRDRHEYLPNGNTIFEVVMLADEYGNRIGPANPSGMAVDAFGRARVSQPFTLFDSSHRFDDNEAFATSNTATATYEHFANNGLVVLDVDTTDGAEVVRESKRVFSYQPGKSLQVLNTFVMDTAKTGLRQRVGYFGANNGIFIEQSNSDIYFVKRAINSGTVAETRVSKANWNLDTLDGTGPSRKTLDLTKAQIQFIDVEWLGVGTVRTGFVIDGQFIHCHSFHHANEITDTYMQTASLPIRYEIKNTAATASASRMKQICSSIISEGGYELRGEKHAVATPISTPRNLTPAATYLPIISLRLKASELDAVVIPVGGALSGVGNNAYFSWRLVRGGTTSGGSWSSNGNSSVEYNTSGTSFSGGKVVRSGFVTSTTQSVGATDLIGENFFNLQLRRDGLADTAEEFTLLVASKVDNDDIYASLEWEEITR